MRILALLLATTGTSLASFCGNSAIPFSLETLNDGQPVLGCARPTCFGWNTRGLPLSNTASFYRINKRPDGFLRQDKAQIKPFDPKDPHYYPKQYADCDKTYESSECSADNQWVGGIAPLVNITDHPTVLQCCTFEPLRMSTDRGIATVAQGQIVIGGEVLKDGRQYAFDYISNIEKKTNDDGTVLYEVAIRRFPCLPPLENDIDDIVISSEAAVRNFNRHRGKYGDGKNTAYQAPLHEANEPLDLPEGSREQPEFQEQEPAQQVDQNQIQPVQQQGPQPPQPQQFGDNVVVEEVIAQPGFVDVPAPQQPFVQPQPVQQFVQPQVVYQPASSGTGYWGGWSGGGGSGGAYYCFTDDTMVNLLDGSRKRMDELELNDWVAAIGDNGVEYVPVAFWLHRMPEFFAEFQRIELEDGSELKLTGEHYIYKTECDRSAKVGPNEVTSESVFAKEVKEGDCLYRAQGNDIIMTKVDRVSTVNSTGIYSPMTASGKILVNDIYASCHTLVQSHSLQNSFFSYVDYFNNIYDSVFGASNSRDVPLGLDTLMGMIDIVLPKNLVTM